MFDVDNNMINVKLQMLMLSQASLQLNEMHSNQLTPLSEL